MRARTSISVPLIRTRFATPCASDSAMEPGSTYPVNTTNPRSWQRAFSRWCNTGPASQKPLPARTMPAPSRPAIFNECLRDQRQCSESNSNGECPRLIIARAVADRSAGCCTHNSAARMAIGLSRYTGMSSSSPSRES